MKGAEIGKPADTLLKNGQTVPSQQATEKEPQPGPFSFKKRLLLGTKTLRLQALGRQAGQTDSIKGVHKLFLGRDRKNNRGNPKTDAAERGKGLFARCTNR